MRELPVIVLGGAGYVAGELLRLLAMHPHLQPAAIVSRSQAGKAVPEVFPHLRGVWDTLKFVGEDAVAGVLAGAASEIAVFSCLPHGEAAARVDRLLDEAVASNVTLHVVDLSADFRLPSVAHYEEVYGGSHGAPDRYDAFTCALPDLEAHTPSGPVAHPGCFTTAVTLACAPAHVGGLASGPFRVAAVTGSTGSGRNPSPTTHHPERHGSLKAYLPLHHRHAPEMSMLLARVRDGGDEPEVLFVPHSGPFARGIHATVHVELARAMTTEQLLALYTKFYADAPFVSVSDQPPVLKEVIGTNRCRIGVAASGSHGVVFSVIDNLTKGAAGGAVQWMNRLCGFEPDAGLRLPALGWN